MRIGNGISLGDIVWLKYPDGEIVVVQIVLPGEDMSIPEGVISITLQSPVAQAILGKQAGNVVLVETPTGKTSVTILSVAHPQAAAGNREANDPIECMVTDMVAALVVVVLIVGCVFLYLASVPMPWELGL